MYCVVYGATFRCKAMALLAYMKSQHVLATSVAAVHCVYIKSPQNMGNMGMAGALRCFSVSQRNLELLPCVRCHRVRIRSHVYADAMSL